MTVDKEVSKLLDGIPPWSARANRDKDKEKNKDKDRVRVDKDRAAHGKENAAVGYKGYRVAVPELRYACGYLRVYGLGTLLDICLHTWVLRRLLYPDERTKER